MKVLVTGPWYSTTSPYTVLFDNVSVQAQLVQSGVLRCYCPGTSVSCDLTVEKTRVYVINNELLGDRYL